MSNAIHYITDAVRLKLNNKSDYKFKNRIRTHFMGLLALNNL